MGIHQVLQGGLSFTVTPNTTVINEGGTVVFNVKSSGVTNGTVLYWTVSGISAGRFSGGVTHGSVVVNSNAASVPITVVPNYAVDGSTSFILTLKTTSQSGSIVATSTPITVNDTSQDRPHGQVTFTNTSAWFVPLGVISANFTMCGGGGGGGGGDGGDKWNHPGGGGGGAANRVSYTVPVTGGTYLTITIGYGGGAGAGGSQAANGNGTAGGATYVTGPGVSLSAPAAYGGYGTYFANGAGGTGVAGGGNGHAGTMANAAGGVSNNGGANGGYGGSFRQNGGHGAKGNCTITY